MPAKEESPPAHMLAGKRTGELVMRNGESELSPVLSHGTADISAMGLLDECPSNDEIVQQRLRALESANLIRMERADVRRRLERGELDFDEFLDDIPSSCSSVSLMKALQWVPDVGRIRATKIVKGLRPFVSEDVRLVELDQRTKYALSEQVRERRYRSGEHPGRDVSRDLWP